MCPRTIRPPAALRLTFRSFRATLCIIVPLAIVSYLAYVLMVWLGIGFVQALLVVSAFNVLRVRRTVAAAPA